MGVERVDVDRDPDDDDAVVVGPGESGGDRDEGQRRALERARPGRSCRRRGRGGSPARRRRWWCRAGSSAGQLGAACSSRPGALAAAAIAPSGQWVSPRSEPVSPGGIVKLRSPRNWSPSSRSSFRWKSLKPPACEFEVPASRRGLKGRTWPGQSAPPGAEAIETPNSDLRSASRSFQGKRSVSVLWMPQRVGVASTPRSEAKRWMPYSSNGSCGRSSKTAFSCPVFGSGGGRRRTWCGSRSRRRGSAGGTGCRASVRRSRSSRSAAREARPR